MTGDTELPLALDAELRETGDRAGRLSYYVAGDGPPLLLIHSINAAGSAYEIKPIFDHFVKTRRVYAPDLPGFGFSDRSRREYTVTLYTDAIRDVLDAIAIDSKNQSVDALALSLSSEFLARAARDEPARFRSLAMVTPTGFRKGSDKLRDAEGSTREIGWFKSFVNVSLWRRGLFRGLVRPSVIRYFLKRTWGAQTFDEGLAAYDDKTTHQPGAENAPLAFLSGSLFSRDIRNVYESLEMPVWLPHGTRGDFKDFSEADWAREKSNWQVQAWETGALPHFEQTEAFTAAYAGFLDSA
ncbi:MAG: alpha/beta hydrolase [Woeseiaceae bacterium]|nr:alpha/beta hydrolase [Woeseiaceae bacterium]